MAAQQRSIERVEAMTCAVLLVSGYSLAAELALPLAGIAVVLVVVRLAAALYVAATAGTSDGSVQALVDVLLDGKLVLANGAGVLTAVLFVGAGDAELQDERLHGLVEMWLLCDGEVADGTGEGGGGGG